jgi:Tfp pilus assembly protein PilF
MKYLLLILLLASCSSTQKKERSPEDKKADLHFDQGTKELVRGEFHSALKNLRISAQYRPEDAKTQNNLGMAYFYRKSPLNAIKHLERAVKLDSKNQDARLNLGSVLMESGNFNKARIQFNEILKSLVYEQQYKTYYNLGILALKQNKLNEAIKNFKMSVEINLNYCPSYFKLGKIYSRVNKPTEALKYFDTGSKGVCYSLFDPTREYVLLLIKLKQFVKADLKISDAQERFSKIEQQQEIRKWKRYLNIKKSKVI